MSSSKHSTLIIVGAGVSGIKAAIDLHANGVETLILEARDRIGGRIFTYESPLTKRKYDIGASWYHECAFNPLFKKMRGMKDLSYTFDDASLMLIGPEGEIPGSYKLDQVVNEMKLFASKETDQSINLHTLSNKYIVENKDILSKEQIEYAPQLLRMSEIMAGSWDMSNGSKSNGPYGGRDAFVVSHYDSVLKKELEGYPEDKIKLNQVVKSINKEKVISITTTDGTEYTCDYCIITIPQSVITLPVGEEGSISFTPQLPASISDNFSKLASVSLAKVVFEFDECFWPKDIEKFIYIGEPDKDFSEKVSSLTTLDLSTVPVIPFNQPNDQLKAQPWKFPFLCVNLQAVKGVPTLLCLVPTPFSIQLENAQSEQIWEIFKPLFDKLGQVKQPLNIFTTSWNDDPYSRGAVSSVKPEGLFVNDGFIQGWDNIRFAGEHTIYEGHGCVHGAWISGQREAKYVINLLK